MPEYKVGQRVKWKWNEPSAAPEELRGEIVGVYFTYTVRWDDGDVEKEIGEDDLEADE